MSTSLIMLIIFHSILLKVSRISFASFSSINFFFSIFLLNTTNIFYIIYYFCGMTTLTITLNLVIAITLLNVWLIRYNKQTMYRGGDANSLAEEFSMYGLPKWLMYIVGSMKIIIAILLIVGVWLTSINIYCYIALVILMLGAIIMHLKVKDKIIKSVPALSILTLLLILLGKDL